VVVLVSLGLGASVEAAPAFRKTITINAGQVTGGPHVSFPFLFSTTDPDLRTTANGGRVRTGGGWDIVFSTSPTCADSTSCKLDHQVERYDAATGELIAWVRVPSLDNGTVLYLHYSDTAVVAATENPFGVWDAGYRGVFHLRETPPAVVNDSTTNANNGTPENSPTQAAGQIDGSLLFDGQLSPNERDVLVPHSASLQLAASMTVSAWVRVSGCGPVGDCNQSRVVVAKWLVGGSNNYWLGKLNSTTFAFFVDGTRNVPIAFGLVGDGLWHHVVGVADVGANGLSLYVDGTLQNSVAGYPGSQTGTSALRIGMNPDAIDQGWVGGIDEVRVSSGVRSAGWIATEHRNQSAPSGFYSICECGSPLATTPGAGTFTVTAADGFELRFNTATGGGIDQLFDLAEDPARTTDLAGAIGTFPGALVASSLRVGGLFYNSAYDSAGRLELLEATSVRARVRQGARLIRAGVGLSGVGQLTDTSIFGSGRTVHALRRSTTAGVTHTGAFFDVNLHYQSSGPLSSWAVSAQNGALPSFGTDDFLLAQNEVPFGRTDVLAVLHKDWTLANGYTSAATITSSETNAPNEWLNPAWDDGVGTTVPAGTSELWNLLLDLKPNDRVDRLDPRVIARAGDYRGPDPLSAIGPGSGWNENTADADFFNESEGAYTLDLDPSSGLQFDINGNRYAPSFKIRQWRSLAPPPTMTLEGVALARNAHYRADLKPVTRAHFADRVLYHSTLQNLLAVSSSDVGQAAGATENGISYLAGRYGAAAAFDSTTDWIAIPLVDGGTANAELDRGRIEFWYLPASAHTDGAERYLFDIDNDGVDGGSRIRIKKEGAALSNELTVEVVDSGGTTRGVTIPSASYRWDAFEWVHLAIEWDGSDPTDNVRGYLNGVQLVPVATANGTFTMELENAAGVIRLGNRAVSPGFWDANGLIDEFTVYSADTTPRALANGGLNGATEYLADTAPARNFPLAFSGVNASRQGQYLYLGSDAKLHGYNVGLATAGASAMALGTLRWEYWNGSAWGDLEAGCPGACAYGFGDTTNDLRKSGNVFWTTDPAGWSPYSVNGGPDLYYVRAWLGSGASYSVTPVEAKLTTDVLLYQYCGDITASAQTFVFTAPVPTEVKLESFTASPGDRSVRLDWRTASELRNLGFHVYRAASADGPWTRLNSGLIPGLGSSAVGQPYSFSDTGLVNGTRYYYRLEDVDASGKATAHGPVSAVPTSGSAAVGGAGGGDATRGGNERERDSSSCPAWVLSAYGAGGGVGTAGALRCTAHGDSQAASLEILSRDARQATLELRTGGFYALHEIDGTVRVFVAGFDFPEDEQQVALPVRRALVDAVVGRKVRLGAVRALELQGFKGLVPSALGQAQMEVGRDGTVRAVRRAAPGAPAREAARRQPKEWARLLPSLFQGETKSAVVEIAPLEFDAQRQQLVLAKRVRLRLLFTAREAGEAGRGSVGRRKPPRDREPAASDELLARLHTTSWGLHAVAYEELPAIRGRVLAAKELRLMRGAEPVAFHVEPTAEGFGPGSRLYFFADRSARSVDYSGELAYELSRAPGGVRMAPASAAPGGSPLGSAPTGWSRFEENRFYQPGLLEAPDPWLWEALFSGAMRVRPFTLTGVSAAGTATLELDLQGASESGMPVDHHVVATLNGAPVGAAQFAGKKPYRMSLSLEASLLREGANELQLTNVGDTGVSSLVFLDRFELVFPQAAVAASGRFEGVWPQSGTASVAGLAAPAALLDVTGAAGPAGGTATSLGADGVRWLSGWQAAGGALRFRAEAGRRYLAVSQEAVLAPRVATVEPSSLRAATNQADYLLVTPRSFLAAVGPLVERRRDQGLSARAVAFEEIADAFGHGRPSAEAIRDFLAYAYHSWQRPSPRYVLLVGDSSYDPRNFTGSSQPAPLPALWTKTSYLWTASDALLAAVNGEDALPDLAIGRLPATTLVQAEALVRKLLAWEESGQGLSGAAALVADNPDFAGDFEADVEDIRASFLAARETRVLKLSELGSETRPAIRDALDAGLGYLGYAGHGGAAVWASENVWNSWDATSLQAQSRQPLLVTMNCLNGYFVAPAYDSLAESLVKAEGRGAIAAFSPSGLSLDGPAHQYHRALMAELTSARHERLGDALLAAQRAYAKTGLMPELVSVYHLLGDPATRIE
jgi:hypothetical protein